MWYRIGFVAGASCIFPWQLAPGLPTKTARKRRKLIWIVSRQAAFSGPFSSGFFKFHVVLHNWSLSWEHTFFWGVRNGCVNVEVNDNSRGLEIPKFDLMCMPKRCRNLFLICSHASVEPQRARVPQTFSSDGIKGYSSKEVIIFVQYFEAVWLLLYHLVSFLHSPIFLSPFIASSNMLFEYYV